MVNLGLRIRGLKSIKNYMVGDNWLVEYYYKSIRSRV